MNLLIPSFHTTESEPPWILHTYLMSYWVGTVARLSTEERLNIFN